jgi:imidazolonepropionase-like amidohydrolase
LIDTHLHFALGPGKKYEKQFQYSDGLQLASGIVNAQFTLESGVTTARDLGARKSVAIDLRKAERMNIIQAPRLLVCGRSITMTGGHFYFCYAEVDGYEVIKRTTRQLLMDNVDFIKIMTSGGGTEGTLRQYPSYSVDEIIWAVDVSHSHGKNVTAHCHAIRNAVEAGVNIIEHCSFLEPYKDGYRSVFNEDLAMEIVKKNIYFDNVLSFGLH